MIILQSPFPVQGYSAEALAFFARLGTQPSDARKTIYDRLISGLVYSGVWAKLDALYILAAADAVTARTNLKQSAFGASVVGTPTFAADGGYTGTNLPTSYLNTGFDPTVGTPNFVRNSASIFAWKNTNPAGDEGGLTGTTDNLTYIYTPRTDGRFYWRINGSNSSLIGFANNMGLFETTRLDGSNFQAYLSGVLLAGSPSASVAPGAGQPIRIVWGDTVGTSAQIAAGGFGSGLTAPDSRNLTSYIQNYLTDILGGTRPLQLLSSFDVVNDGLGNTTPGMCRLVDGRLLAVYSVGVAQADSKVVMRTSSDNGKTWSAATDIVTPAASHTWIGTSIKQVSTGTILISLVYAANNGSTQVTYVIRGTVAGDLSISWGSPIIVTNNYTAPNTESYVLELADGRLMLGIYGFTQGKVGVVFSSNDGVSWSGQVDIITGNPQAGDGFTESNFVQLASGTIVGLIRNDNQTTPSRTGFWRTTSTDGGATWSAITQVIPNTVASAPSRIAMTLAPNGKIFLMSRFIGPGGGSQTGYTYSTDDGVTWATVMIYYNIGTKTYGQHISAQVFYDTATQTLMSIMGLGTFSVAQITFQQFYLP